MMIENQMSIFAFGIVQWNICGEQANITEDALKNFIVRLKNRKLAGMNGVHAKMMRE